MYSVVVAAMHRAVVAVDADPVNLAYLRKSLELGGATEFVRIVYNSVRSASDNIFDGLNNHKTVKTKPSKRTVIFLNSPVQ